MRITNEDNKEFGLICGELPRGAYFIVIGEYAQLVFHSDSTVQEKGFLIFFSVVPKPGEQNYVDWLLTGDTGLEKIYCDLSQIYYANKRW